MLGYTALMQELHLKKMAFAVTKWVGSPSSIVTHTMLFIVSFAASYMGWVSFDRMLLVLTTIVSLEAIYLAIFIQMTLNFTTKTVEDISEDVEEISEDVEEISEDVAEIQEDVEDISVDVDEMADEDVSEEQEEEERKQEQKKTLADIQTDLRRLMEDISK